MRVYLLPGLGFDHRIFSRLKLEGFPHSFIDWIQPEKEEALHAYAERMARSVPSKGETVLVGHSFGGILCQEIATIRQVQKIILISSIKSEEELPIHFKVVAPLHLEKLFTRNLTLRTLEFWGAYHDYAKGTEQELVKNMISKQSNQYLQWALKNLSAWSRPKLPEQTEIVHIHGELDKTLPIGRIKGVDYPIKGGGHFMVYKRAGEIRELLLREINKA